MAILRSPIALSSFTRWAASPSIRQPLLRNMTSTPSRFVQGYGDGEGDPRGENPSQQGSSSYETHSREHPGPKPPAAGKGTGAGPTKGDAKAPGESSVESGGSRSKEVKDTGSSPTGGSMSGGRIKGRASPIIHDRSELGSENSEYQAEVEKHNRDIEQRYERASEAEDDKVDKKFWKCQGGKSEST